MIVAAARNFRRTADGLGVYDVKPSRLRENDLAIFNRRLPLTALEVVGDLLSKESWMRDFLAQWAPSGSAGGLRLAIRNGSVNLYSCGQSIGKVSFGQGGRTPTLKVHEKYVRRSATGQRYLRIGVAEGLDADGDRCKWGGPQMLETWIANSECYRGDEKRCIDALLAVSPKVIDLEMGLPAFGGRKGAPRMDMVALEESNGGVRIVFWEAKMIRDSRIRSKTTPEVFKQLDSYEAYLADAGRRDRVVEAYRENCRLLGALRDMVAVSRKVASLDPLVLEAATLGSRVEIERKPRLVVFDDGCKRREEAWQGHLKKLRERVPVAFVAPTSSIAIESLARKGG